MIEIAKAAILLYVRDKIIVLPLNRCSLPPHIGILFFELNLRNRKWLVCCSYNLHKNLIEEHLRVLTKGIQFYSESYENILFMGDYNVEITETNMSSSCEIYHLTDIIKQPKLLNTETTKVLETKFRIELTNILHLNIIDSRNTEFFKNIFLKVLNKQAPIKVKNLRANHSHFVTKELSKVIMLRSKLRNQYLKWKSEEVRIRFKIQKNLCITLLRKAKHHYYENLRKIMI